MTYRFLAKNASVLHERQGPPPGPPRARGTLRSIRQRVHRVHLVCYLQLLQHLRWKRVTSVTRPRVRVGLCDSVMGSSGSHRVTYAVLAKNALTLHERRQREGACAVRQPVHRTRPVCHSQLLQHLRWKRATSVTRPRVRVDLCDSVMGSSGSATARYIEF